MPIVHSERNIAQAFNIRKQNLTQYAIHEMYFSSMDKV